MLIALIRTKAENHFVRTKFAEVLGWALKGFSFERKDGVHMGGNGYVLWCELGGSRSVFGGHGAAHHLSGGDCKRYDHRLGYINRSIEQLTQASSASNGYRIRLHPGFF